MDHYFYHMVRQFFIYSKTALQCTALLRAARLQRAGIWLREIFAIIAHAAHDRILKDNWTYIREMVKVF